MSRIEKLEILLSTVRELKAEYERELSPEVKQFHWQVAKHGPNAWQETALKFGEVPGLKGAWTMTNIEAELVPLLDQEASRGKAPDLRLGKVRKWA
jgi:hypothetical protein